VKKFWLYFLSVLLLAFCIVNAWFELFALNLNALWSFGDEADGVEVLSFNIHGPDVNYAQYEDEIISLILREDADIVYLAECPVKHAKLDSAMSTRYPYATDVNSSSWDAFYAKYPIVQMERLQNNSIDKMIVSKGVFNVDGKPLKVYGCHLTSNNYVDNQHRLDWDSIHTRAELQLYFQMYKRASRYRAEEVRTLVHDLKSDSLPTIIMGDMNDFAGSSALSGIKKAGFQDAWWKKGLGYGKTFHRRKLHLRIDHIFYQPEFFDLQEVDVIQTNASDHNALKASLKCKF